jgi:rare lipoprotein A
MRAVAGFFLAAFAAIACAGPAALAETATKPKEPAHATAQPGKSAKHAARKGARAGKATRRRVGKASVYHDNFQGHKTATGETFSQHKLTAASPDLPLGSKATVTNRKNGKSVEVEVNDRGPHVDGRVIDLSKTAAKRIGVDGDKEGVAPVTVETKPPQ